MHRFASYERELLARFVALPPAAWVCTVAGLVTVMGWPYWHQHPGLWLVVELSLIPLVLNGTVYLRSGTGRRMGALFICAALLNAISWSGSYDAGLGPLAGEWGGALFYLVIGMGVLLCEQDRYPSMVERSCAVFVAVALLGAQAMVIFMLTPVQLGYSADVTWPPTWGVTGSDRALVVTMTNSVYLAALVVFGGTMVRRAYLSGAGRRQLGQLAVLVTAVLGAATQIHYIRVASGPESYLFAQVLHSCAMAIIPVATFAAGAQQRYRRVAVTTRVVKECTGSTLPAIQSSFNHVVSPSQVRLGVWLPSADAYLDDEGNLHDDPPRDQGHVWDIVEAGGGRCIGYAQITAAHPEPETVTAALAALRSSLRAIQAELDAQEVVRAAQSRVLVAEEAGRRQLARILHDRVQQQLLAIAVDLGRASASEAGPPADFARRNRARIEDLVEEIRHISRGVYPPMLVHYGLDGALEEVAEQLGMPICLNLTTPRLLPSAELTMFFAMSEAITNTFKHAGSCSVWVRTWSQGRRVYGEVQDDGCGGAALRLGGGLHGAADRVHALGGSLEVRSSEGAGSVVRISIPDAIGQVVGVLRADESIAPRVFTP